MTQGEDAAGPEAAGPGTVDEQVRLLLSEIAHSVAGIDAVGILELGRDGRVRPRVASDPRARGVDRCQADRGGGPAVDALGDGGSTVVVSDAATEQDRWSDFVAAAAEAGLASLVSVPLAPTGAPPMVVTFYAAAPQAFDTAGARGLAAALALEVAGPLLGSHRTLSLRRTHAPGDLLAHATGIAVERFALDEQGALALLLREARESGRDLVDVASRLAEDGARDEQPTSRWIDDRGDGSPGRGERRDHLERREALEDEREGLAQHRERLADSRENLADDREARADAREQEADRREADLAEREATVSQLAQRVGLASTDQLDRADEALGRSHAAVERTGATVTRSRAALTRQRELHAREQEEIDRESLDSARSAAVPAPDPSDPSDPSGGRVGRS